MVLLNHTASGSITGPRPRPSSFLGSDKNPGAFLGMIQAEGPLAFSSSQCQWITSFSKSMTCLKDRSSGAPVPSLGTMLTGNHFPFDVLLPP